MLEFNFTQNVQTTKKRILDLTEVFSSFLLPMQFNLKPVFDPKPKRGPKFFSEARDRRFRENPGASLKLRV